MADPSSGEGGGEPRANPETAKFLCDLAVKRHDLADRTYDALNTRLAALFAFNGFLVPAGMTAIRAAISATPANLAPIQDPARTILMLAWGVSLLVVAVACVVGYMAKPLKSLPNAVALYRDFGAGDLTAAAPHVLVALDEAWKKYRDAMETKSNCVNAALAGIAAQVGVLMLTFVASL